MIGLTSEMYIPYKGFKRYRITAKDATLGTEIRERQNANYERFRRHILDMGTFPLARALDRVNQFLDLPQVDDHLPMDRERDIEGQKTLHYFHEKLGIGNFQTLNILYHTSDARALRAVNNPPAASVRR